MGNGHETYQKIIFLLKHNYYRYLYSLSDKNYPKKWKNPLNTVKIILY